MSDDPDGRDRMGDRIVTAGFIGGLALVAAGVAMIYLPAGLIVAGIELVATIALYVRSSG